MICLGDLSPADLRRRLRLGTLWLQTGPVTFAVRSSLGDILERLRLLYPDFPVRDPNGFADFHISVRKSAGVRRLFKPQSVFELDGFRPFHPLPGSQAFAILEWGMNWCLYSHAHWYLILHGAVLERHGSAILLPAPSGSGKSTLAAALMCRGWRLLSDELILYRPDTQDVIGLGRPVSLKNASIDVIRRWAPEAVLSEPMHDTAKGSVAHLKPSKLSVDRLVEPAVPRLICFPQYQSGSETRVEPVSRGELFMTLADNAFNYSTLRERGFHALANMVDGCTGVRIRYANLDEAIDVLDQQLRTRSC